MKTDFFRYSECGHNHHYCMVNNKLAGGQCARRLNKFTLHYNTSKVQTLSASFCFMVFHDHKGNGPRGKRKRIRFIPIKESKSKFKS